MKRITVKSSTYPRIKYLALFIAASMAPALVPAYAAVDISQKPLFLGRNAPPLNQLIVGRDHKLYYEAYNDASDLNGDGVLDYRFTPSIIYYGYFDSAVCYSYDNNLFTPVAAAGALNTCANRWSGNFLNYITTSRIDALRKVLYGGFREVDSATDTILRRSFIPRDAHTWGKEYRSIAIDGYDIRLYTPLNTPNAGTQHLFGNLSIGTTGMPLMRVVQNGTLRVWAWVSREGGTILNDAAGSFTDFSVRVRVCTANFHGDNCYKYPNGNWKPIGLLQEYGETGSMMFGLLTGTYDNNMSGGVLRKRMGSISNEINSTTGQFVRPTGGDIISNLNSLRITQWNEGSYNPGWPGAWLINRAMNPGEFVDWGNPIAEIMYEGLRYFAGKNSATPNFAGGAVDASLNLTTAPWDDPYAYTPKTTTTPQVGFPWCSRPFQLVISDINPSFDSDQVPGGFFGGTGDLAIAAQSQLNTISATEPGFPGLRFIGQSGSVFDGAPTAKNVTSLGNIRGLAPEEPTKQGSYNAAAVAFYGKTNDLSATAAKDQKTDTFIVALASPLPKLEFSVGGKVLSMVPFAKTAGGCLDANGTPGQFQPTNTITDFYIIETYNTHPGNMNASINGGRPYFIFDINFEDVEQAADHDMDAIARYTVSINAAGELQVDMEATQASGCLEQHLGYVMSGSSRDGIYLDVIDRDTSLPAPRYFLDTPAGMNPGDCAPPAMCPSLGYTSSRTFTAGTSAAATLLKDPLWYAAKWGGFIDTNNNNRPDVTAEWDANNDGVPDNYFLVQNPLKLKESLKKLFDSIIALSASQSAVGASTTGSINADSAIFLAGFDSEFWGGSLKGLKFNYSGQPCAAMDVTNGCSWLSWAAEGVMPSPASRNIKFWRANPLAPLLPSEQPFTWATLNAAEKLLFADTANPLGNPDILNYLRGDRSKEIKNGGTLRDRVSSLGAIVNSDPVFVGKADAASRRYERRPSVPGSSSFSAFVTTSAARTKMVYVGVNDGMLHGFNATTGEETFAFMPGEVFSKIKALSQPKNGEPGQPAAGHEYYVDGKIAVGDAYIGGAWKTILVGTTGRGGKTVYALDITDPSNIDVMWERQDISIGQVIGKPQVVLLNNGTWAAVLGNGYNSASAKANLVVINLSSGALIKNIKGELTAVESANGLAQISGWDEENDGDIDYFYGGDLLGRLWKFDLTGNNPNTWSASHMFTTSDGGSPAKAQPITGGTNVMLNPEDGKRYVMFGTGRYMGGSDVTDMQVNAVYGIQDSGSTVTSVDLITRAIVYDVISAAGKLTLAVEEAAVNDMSGKKGWKLPLLSPVRGPEGQRIYNSPLVFGKSVVFSVNIPKDDPCEPGGTSYALAIDPFKGSRLTFNFFDIDGNSVVDSSDTITLPDGTQVPASGIYFDALSAEPTAMGDYLLVGQSDGSYKQIKTNSGLKKGRLSWREIVR